jgi:hypothetical protein
MLRVRTEVTNRLVRPNGAAESGRPEVISSSVCPVAGSYIPFRKPASQLTMTISGATAPELGVSARIFCPSGAS